MTTLVNSYTDKTNEYRIVWEYETGNGSTYSKTELYALGAVQVAKNDYRRIMDLEKWEMELFPKATFRLEVSTRYSQESHMWNSRLARFADDSKNVMELYYEEGEMSWNGDFVKETGWVRVRIYGVRINPVKFPEMNTQPKIWNYENSW